MLLGLVTFFVVVHTFSRDCICLIYLINIIMFYSVSHLNLKNCFASKSFKGCL